MEAAVAVNAAVANTDDSKKVPIATTSSAPIPAGSHMYVNQPGIWWGPQQGGFPGQHYVMPAQPVSMLSPYGPAPSHPGLHQQGTGYMSVPPVGFPPGMVYPPGNMHMFMMQPVVGGVVPSRMGAPETSASVSQYLPAAATTVNQVISVATTEHGILSTEAELEKGNEALKRPTPAPVSAQKRDFSAPLSLSIFGEEEEVEQVVAVQQEKTDGETKLETDAALRGEDMRIPNAYSFSNSSSSSSSISPITSLPPAANPQQFATSFAFQEQPQQKQPQKGEEEEDDFGDFAMVRATSSSKPLSPFEANSQKQAEQDRSGSQATEVDDDDFGDFASTESAKQTPASLVQEVIVSNQNFMFQVPLPVPLPLTRPPLPDFSSEDLSSSVLESSAGVLEPVGDVSVVAKNGGVEGVMIDAGDGASSANHGIKSSEKGSEEDDDSWGAFSSSVISAGPPVPLGKETAAASATEWWMSTDMVQPSGLAPVVEKGRSSGPEGSAVGGDRFAWNEGSGGEDIAKRTTVGLGEGNGKVEVEVEDDFGDFTSTVGGSGAENVSGGDNKALGLVQFKVTTEGEIREGTFLTPGAKGNDVAGGATGSRISGREAAPLSVNAAVMWAFESKEKETRAGGGVGGGSEGNTLQSGAGNGLHSGNGTAGGGEKKGTEEEEEDDFGGFMSSSSTINQPSQKGTPSTEEQFSFGAGQGSEGHSSFDARLEVLRSSHASTASGPSSSSSWPTPLPQPGSAFSAFAVLTSSSAVPASSHTFMSVQSSLSLDKDDDDDFGNFETAGVGVTVGGGRKESNSDDFAISHTTSGQNLALNSIDDSDFGDFASSETLNSDHMRGVDGNLDIVGAGAKEQSASKVLVEEEGERKDEGRVKVEGKVEVANGGQSNPKGGVGDGAGPLSLSLFGDDVDGDGELSNAELSLGFLPSLSFSSSKKDDQSTAAGAQPKGAGGAAIAAQTENIFDLISTLYSSDPSTAAHASSSAVPLPSSSSAHAASSSLSFSSSSFPAGSLEPSGLLDTNSFSTSSSSSFATSSVLPFPLPSSGSTSGDSQELRANGGVSVSTQQGQNFQFPTIKDIALPISPEISGLPFISSKLGQGRVSARLESTFLTYQEALSKGGGEDERFEEEDDEGGLRMLEGVVERLVEEGRVEEALACKRHRAAFARLPLVRASYFSALNEGKVEDAATYHKKMKSMEAAVGSADDIQRWESPRHMIGDGALGMEDGEGRASGEERGIGVGVGVVGVGVGGGGGEGGGGGGLRVAGSEPTTVDGFADALGRQEGDARAKVFGESFRPEDVVRVAKSDLRGAVGVLARARYEYRILRSASAEQQVQRVTEWANLATACLSALENAALLLRDADAVDHRDSFLSSPQGQSLIAASAQIYGVHVVLATSAQLYATWLGVTGQAGKSLWSALERTAKAWEHGGLLEASRAVLPRVARGLAWSTVDGIAETAELAAAQAASAILEGRVEKLVCSLSLLPILAFSSVPAVEWEGRRYLLPLVNLWANRVSNKSPPSVALARSEISVF